MKLGDSGDSFEKDIGLKDKASDLDKLTTMGEKGEVRQCDKSMEKFSWKHECQHYKKGDITSVLKIIDTVQEGISIDIKQGRRKGETSPPEFWARVWDEIHRSGGGPPENLPNKTLKNKWNEMQNSGKSSDEIWEHMEREYPGPFLLVPLVKRWHHLGQGKPVEHVKMFDGLEQYNYIMLMIEDKPETAQLREKLEKMKEEKREEEFWAEHWDEIHGMQRMKAICDDKSSRRRRQKQGDWEQCFFPQRRTDSEGNEIKMIPGYQKHYPLGYSFYNRLRKNADERPIYKEFDFCS